jgi:hypothetical protein
MGDEALDFLLASGGRAVKFEKPGDKVLGLVRAMEKRQDTDLDGKPRVWDNGQPRWMLVVTLEVEPEDEDDNGMRNLYVNKPNMRQAIADAMRAKGWSASPVGGKLFVKFVKTEPASQRGFLPKKVFTAAFDPPAQPDASDLGLGEHEGQAPPDEDIPF